MFTLRLRHNKRQQICNFDNMTFLELKHKICEIFNIDKNIMLCTVGIKLDDEYNDVMLSELDINNTTFNIDEDSEKELKCVVNITKPDFYNKEAVERSKKQYEKFLKEKKEKEEHKKLVLQQHEEEREEAYEKSKKYTTKLMKEQDLKKPKRNVNDFIKVKTLKRIKTYKVYDKLTINDLLQKLNKAGEDYNEITSLEGKVIDKSDLLNKYRAQTVIAK